jgi:hypothetical protein
MAVASGELLSSTKGAELIRQSTDRPCSRQNLEKLCRQGKLPKSTVSTSPVRVRGDLLVAEYQANIDLRQSGVDRPGVKGGSRPVVPDDPLTPPAQEFVPSEGESPDYNTERAWTEYEKKLKLRTEREQLEKKLVYREDVEQVQKAVALTLVNQIETLPQQIKNQVPHLTVEEQALIQKLVNQLLMNVAEWKFSEAEVAG